MIEMELEWKKYRDKRKGQKNQRKWNPILMELKHKTKIIQKRANFFLLYYKKYENQFINNLILKDKI